MEKRSFRPMFIGAAINNFLRKIGASASDSDLSARWKDIICEDSEFIKISRNKHIAYIRAKNPAAKLILSYKAPEIIKKINAYFGYEAVSKIIVK